MHVIAPTIDAFFATATGVCVYVHVGGHAIRVQFESVDARATADGPSVAETELALAVASEAFERYRGELRALFEQVTLELNERRGTPDEDQVPTSSDMAAFGELSGIVARAGLRGAEAQRLGLDIERACAVGAESEAFTNIVCRLPALDAMRIQLQGSQQRQREVLMMLAAILSATPSRPRSGTMSALRSLTARKTAGKG